jgi:hypothetical protein
MNIYMRLSERLFLNDRPLSASLREKGARRAAVSTNPFSFPSRAQNNNITSLSLSQAEITRENASAAKRPQIFTLKLYWLSE